MRTPNTDEAARWVVEDLALRYGSTIVAAMRASKVRNHHHPIRRYWGGGSRLNKLKGQRLARGLIHAVQDDPWFEELVGNLFQQLNEPAIAALLSARNRWPDPARPEEITQTALRWVIERFQLTPHELRWIVDQMHPGFTLPSEIDVEFEEQGRTLVPVLRSAGSMLEPEALLEAERDDMDSLCLELLGLWMPGKEPFPPPVQELLHEERLEDAADHLMGLEDALAVQAVASLCLMSARLDDACEVIERLPEDDILRDDRRRAVRTLAAFFDHRWDECLDEVVCHKFRWPAWSLIEGLAYTGRGEHLLGARALIDPECVARSRSILPVRLTSAALKQAGHPLPPGFDEALAEGWADARRLTRLGDALRKVVPAPAPAPCAEGVSPEHRPSPLEAVAAIPGVESRPSHLGDVTQADEVDAPASSAWDQPSPVPPEDLAEALEQPAGDEEVADIPSPSAPARPEDKWPQAVVDSEYFARLRSLLQQSEDLVALHRELASALFAGELETLSEVSAKLQAASTAWHGVFSATARELDLDVEGLLADFDVKPGKLTSGGADALAALVDSLAATVGDVLQRQRAARVDQIERLVSLVAELEQELPADLESLGDDELEQLEVRLTKEIELQQLEECVDDGSLDAAALADLGDELFGELLQRTAAELDGLSELGLESLAVMLADRRVSRERRSALLPVLLERIEPTLHWLGTAVALVGLDVGPDQPSLLRLLELIERAGGDSSRWAGALTKAVRASGATDGATLALLAEPETVRALTCWLLEHGASVDATVWWPVFRALCERLAPEERVLLISRWMSVLGRGAEPELAWMDQLEALAVLTRSLIDCERHDEAVMLASAAFAWSGDVRQLEGLSEVLVEVCLHLADIGHADGRRLIGQLLSEPGWLYALDWGVPAYLWLCQQCGFDDKVRTDRYRFAREFEGGRLRWPVLVGAYFLTEVFPELGGRAEGSGADLDRAASDLRELDTNLERLSCYTAWPPGTSYQRIFNDWISDLRDAILHGGAVGAEAALEKLEEVEVDAMIADADHRVGQLVDGAARASMRRYLSAQISRLSRLAELQQEHDTTDLMKLLERDDSPLAAKLVRERDLASNADSAALRGLYDRVSRRVQ